MPPCAPGHGLAFDPTGREVCPVCDHTVLCGDPARFRIVDGNGDEHWVCAHHYDLWEAGWKDGKPEDAPPGPAVIRFWHVHGDGPALFERVEE